MQHFREYFPTFSNMTHRFIGSFLWMLLHLSNVTRLKFQLAHFSHHASSWPSKDRCIWSRFIPPGLPQLDDQKNSCTLPPLSFYASATVFNWDLSAPRSSKARCYSYERPRSGSNWDLSPDLCSQTFQLLFHLISPSQWWQRPHSRSWWPINLSTTNGSLTKIWEQRFGSWVAKFLACILFKAKGLRLTPFIHGIVMAAT